MSPLRLPERLSADPILARENQARARSWAMPFTMALYVCGLGGFALVMFSIVLSDAPDRRPSAIDMAEVAFLTSGLQLVLALLMVPALAAGAITSEKERGTLAMVMLGRLGARRVVVSKLASATTYLAMLVVIALPVMTAVYLYAGLGMTQLVITEAVVLTTSIGLAALAILVSSLMARTVTATLVSYVAAVVLWVGLALAAAVVLDFREPLNPAQAPYSSLHPVVLANPFYAVHAAVIGPSPAGAKAGHVVQLLLFRQGDPEGWGPVVQPWQLSVLANLALGAVCLVFATRKLDGHSLRAVLRRPVHLRRRPRTRAQVAPTGL